MPSSVDVSIFPQYFGIFPVKVHDDEAEVSRGCDAARGLFQKMIPGFQIPRPHSAGPHGNFCALNFPEGDIQRVRLATEVIEALWVYDDMVEEIPYGEAQDGHAHISNVLDNQSITEQTIPNGQSGNTSRKDLLANIFKNFGPRMTAVDEKGAPRAIEGVKAYLRDWDSKDNTAVDNIADYIKFRELNCGYGIMESFMQWVLDLHIDWQGTQLLRDYYHASAQVMALANDFFSWEVERYEPADRKWNAVPILMEQYKLDEHNARILLKGMLTDAEQRARRIGLQVKEVSEVLAHYVRGMELMLAGNAFWSSTSPRYNP